MININKRMRFLVIDDMTNMRRTIKNMLRYIGFEKIEEASDGDIALKMIHDNKPDFIIADWNMPRMQGIELVRKTKESRLFADIPFLMVTAEVLESQIVQAAESEIDGYIIKPFVAKTLENKISTILDRKNSPTEFDLFIKNGINLKNEKQFEKAIEAFESALKITPKSARVRHLIGETLELKGDTQKAEQMYQEAAKFNPQFVKVHQSLGELYQKTGNSEKAITAFEKAAKISPNSIERQSAIGKLYVNTGNLEKADKAFQQALKSAPDNTSLKTTIGEIYLESGHADKAIESFKGSLSIKEDANVYNRLGIALRRKGKVKEAIDEYVKAIRIAPNDEGLHYNIARAYVEANDKSNAIIHFKEALKIDPNFEDANVMLKKIS